MTRNMNHKFGFIITRNISVSEIIFKIPKVPKLDENTWWGAGKPTKVSIEKIPFTINVSEEILTDLQTRLKTTRPFTPPLEGIRQEYGFNTKELGNILKYWKEKYNWREREKLLNRFPQFITNIQGLNIHYLHVKPTNPKYTFLPLLLLHGWPSSVTEFYKIIPMLANGEEKYGIAFETIVPSLPGYGFSEAAKKSGLGAVSMAVIFKNLMKRIGYDEFYVHGGDWGGMISRHMAVLFPDNVLGLHSTFCYSRRRISLCKILLGSLWPSFLVPIGHETQMYPLRRILKRFILESGYLHLQATKPDTIGVALGQSPIGLAAYILEKFSTLTNPNYIRVENAGLLEQFTYDELLDNIMIYWVTNSMTTSMRLYAESFSEAEMKLQMEEIPISKRVPCAAARFPFDIVYQPDNILKDKYVNLIHSRDFPSGGHFAALENPKQLVKDIYAAVEKMEEMHDCQCMALKKP